MRDDPATEVSRLIDLRARADRALAELERVVSDAPGPMRMALLAISNDVAAREFGDAVTAAIDAVLAEGAPRRAPQVTLDAVLADLDPFAGVLAAMEASGGSTMRLLNAAVGGLEAAITQMRSDAEADIVNAQLVAALLTVATRAGGRRRPPGDRHPAASAAAVRAHAAGRDHSAPRSPSVDRWRSVPPVRRSRTPRPTSTW